MKQINLLLSACLLLLLPACTEGSGSGNGGSGTGGSGGTGTTSSSTGTGTGGGECVGARDCPCGQVACKYTCDGCSKPCDPATPCPDGFWCDYPDDGCGAGQAGVCKQLPVVGGCMESWHPRVCTCGGGVIPSDCPGVVAAVDVSSDPALCSDGTFTCGDLQCKKYLEYCETVLPGQPGPTSYACKTADTCATGIPDCECIEGLPPGACEKGQDGQIRVTIALP